MPIVPHYLRQRAPTADDDRLQFVFKDSTWLDETDNHLYRSDSDLPHNAQWMDITPPSNGGGGPCSWTAITGKPSTFPPSTPIAQASITDLVTALSGKAALSHGHAQSEIANLVADLAAKQASSQKGQANGYASLDGAGLVPSSQLPASAGPFTVVRKTTADQTNTTVNLTNATTLLLPVAANTVYVIEGFLRMRSSLATAGFKLAFDVPALAEICGGVYHAVSAAGAVSGALQRADALNVGATTGVDTINQDVLVYGYWLLVNGANAGNAQLMFAAEVAATVTMRLGSVLRGMVV